jgi:HD superfamily phosphodiesterase
MVLMHLSEKIASSEAKYKKILEEIFNRVFDTSFLPSHGLDHHRRVWLYAVEVLNHLASNGFNSDNNLTDKLIIACFLHDSGMATDPGFRHGAEGRKICEQFLSENWLSPDEFSDVLSAIDNHDKKGYAATNQPGDILTILSVADDLDAFGFIGIYRYLEIYITRNKSMNDLGYLIMENSEKRYLHFLRIYGFTGSFASRHIKRYEILNSFFNSYNEQIHVYKFDNQLPAGFCGIAEIIAQLIKDYKPDLSIISQIGDHIDPVILWFFGELDHELSEFKVL